MAAEENRSPDPLTGPSDPVPPLSDPATASPDSAIGASDPGQVSSDSVTARIALNLDTRRLELSLTVPARPARLADLLPMLRGFANLLVEAAAQEDRDRGLTISCCKGCGACCRQIVPVAEVEARALRDLVESMDEPRRTQVRSRFADAQGRLAAAGLLERLLDPRAIAHDALRPLGIEYFRQAVPCPFLQDECCSIYEDRPIVCREYLVTTPAANCSRPMPQTVRCVPMPRKLSSALYRMGHAGQPNSANQPEHPAQAAANRWVPLVVAPQWADAHPDGDPPCGGGDLLRELLEHLTVKSGQ